MKLKRGNDEEKKKRGLAFKLFSCWSENCIPKQTTTKLITFSFYACQRIVYPNQQPQNQMTLIFLVTTFQNLCPPPPPPHPELPGFATGVKLHTINTLEARLNMSLNVSCFSSPESNRYEINCESYFLYMFSHLSDKNKAW